MMTLYNVRGEAVFQPELEENAFRADNEFGWTRVQIPLVVDILRSHGIGILGGELWWVHERISGTIPQRQGAPAVYCWETNRRPGEPWAHFVQRGSSDALTAVERWPAPDDLPPDLPGRILYNLTWTSEVEFEKLSTKAV
jgi:hypothetical protein